MAEMIERIFGPCDGCDGTGKIGDGFNPVMAIFSLGTSLAHNKKCPVCDGTGRVVVKEIVRTE